MQQPKRTARRVAARARLVSAALGAAVLVLGAGVASALVQPKPQLSVETERTPQGARITLKGKNWPANARVKVTATRAPGANGTQDFGMLSANDKGEFSERKLVQCSTTNMDDAQIERVTFTAADSASGVKATARTPDGSAWVC